MEPQKLNYPVRNCKNKKLVLLSENGICVEASSGNPCSIAEEIQSGEVYDLGITVGASRLLSVWQDVKE